MLDFTSALYLGMNHAHHDLLPWAGLTTGRPAALESPPGAQAVAEDLALLIGCERATLGMSTLHISFDLFQALATEGIALFVDAGTYPIVRWGVERVAAKGVPVTGFPAHDPDTLERALTRNRHSGLRPVVVADGLCPATGRVAPVKAYLDAVREHGGHLVIDDTQALGVLGHHPTRATPLGFGGGGTCAWHNLRAAELIVTCSLAKGFGVPVAVLAGSRTVIEAFERSSATRIHCSAPSAAHISAAAHAVSLNHRQGTHLRRRLLISVQRFRSGLRRAGISARGGFFPIQTPSLGAAAQAVHAELLERGVRSVLHRPKYGAPAQVSFLIRADHQPWQIDRAAQGLMDTALNNRN